MARDVVTKKGEVVRLLNPYEKSKKYAYELKHQILITNFKDVKKNKMVHQNESLILKLLLDVDI